MRLGYVILYVPDLAGTVAFYEVAFGLATRFTHESGYAEMATGATALAFATEELAEGNAGPFRRNHAEEPAAGAEIGLVVEDVAAAFSRATEAGAMAVKAPARKPWGQWVAYVRDCNGFLVELCSEIAAPG